MTTVETLALAQTEGIALEAKDGKIVYHGSRPPSQLLLASLKAHKAALLAILSCPWTEDDRELLTQVGKLDDPMVAVAAKMFGCRIRCIRPAGSKTWIHRRGMTGK